MTAELCLRLLRVYQVLVADQEQVVRLAERALAALPDWAKNYLPEGGATLTDNPVSAVGSLLLNTTDAVVNLLSNSLLVTIFVIFLLIGQGASSEASGVWAGGSACRSTTSGPSTS